MKDGVRPRQPWQDVHSRISGPAAMNVVDNFTERCVAGHALRLLRKSGMRAVPLRRFVSRWRPLGPACVSQLRDLIKGIYSESVKPTTKQP